MDKLEKELSRIDSQFNGSAHITKPGDNIFLDLGFPPKVAKKLRLESEQRINDKIKKSNLKKASEQ
ncbi:MAG TPA: hypothetical protein VES38_02770 [Methylotenera sp.]|nr:hypothetical protein [Methylotenera sp.]